MEAWLQRLIAACLRLGIHKQELMRDYYPAELPMVLDAWTALHGGAQAEAAETADPMQFFGTGGERIDS